MLLYCIAPIFLPVAKAYTVQVDCSSMHLAILRKINSDDHADLAFLFSGRLHDHTFLFFFYCCS